MPHRNHIIQITRSWLGTPYRHQASLKGVGCDCLGLVRGVYAEACGHPAEEPPPYSRDWAEAARRETMIEAAARHLTAVPTEQIEPGDVLIFRLRSGAMAKHSAIMSSQTRMIHAIEGAPVCEVHISPWWRRRIAAAFRFPVTPPLSNTADSQELETHDVKSVQQPSGRPDRARFPA